MLYFVKFVVVETFCDLYSELSLNEMTFIIPRVWTVLGRLGGLYITILGTHQRLLTAQEMK